MSPIFFNDTLGLSERVNAFVLLKSIWKNVIILFIIVIISTITLIIIIITRFGCFSCRVIFDSSSEKFQLGVRDKKNKVCEGFFTGVKL